MAQKIIIKQNLTFKLIKVKSLQKNQKKPGGEDTAAG